MDRVGHVTRALELLNAGDIVGGMEGYAENARFCVPALGVELEGREAIVETMGQFAKDADVRYEVDRLVEEGPLVVVFARSTGLMGGRRMRWGVCMVLRWEGNEIAEEWVLRGDAPQPVETSSPS